MADRNKECVACKVSKLLSDFESTTGDKTRKECKACRASKRKAATDLAKADHQPDKIPKPAACAECGKGPDEVDFKWRDDVKAGGWRSTCNSCYNSKGYHRSFREREREKDEAAYLARNARAHLEWARRNPERVAAQQAKTASEPERRMKQIKTSAKARDISFVDADFAAMMRKLGEPCVFCSFKPGAGETLNGLDRIDTSQGYSDGNTAPCCATCNAMKGPNDVDVFIDNIRRVFRHSGEISVGGGGERKRLPAFGGRAELRAAPAKEKRDELTLEEQIEIWSSPCYLCGRAPSFGIDRVDAGGNYTSENSRPCCSDCNYMKKDLSLDDFKRHVAYVYEWTRTWVVRDVSGAPLKVCTGQERAPVAPEGVDLIFPSIATAARIVGSAHTTLEDALRDGREFRGVKWTRRTHIAYRAQHVAAAACTEIIFALRRPQASGNGPDAFV